MLKCFSLRCYKIEGTNLSLPFEKETVVVLSMVARCDGSAARLIQVKNYHGSQLFARESILTLSRVYF